MSKNAKDDVVCFKSPIIIGTMLGISSPLKHSLNYVTSLQDLNFVTKYLKYAFIHRAFILPSN